MKSDIASYIKEIDMVFPLARITSSLEWVSISETLDITNDYYLIEFISNIYELDSIEKINEIKARSLLAISFITRRIINTCLEIRSGVSANPLERDIQIALKLPGEDSSSVAFLKNGHCMPQGDLESDVAALSLATKKIVQSAGYSDKEESLNLEDLSKLYSKLANIIFNKQ